MSSALDMLNSRLAVSSRRRNTGAATAPSKVAARALAKLTDLASRDALAEAAEARHSERTAGLYAALAQVSQYKELMVHVPEGSAKFVQYATRLSSAEGEVARIYALPIMPSDIRPRGRFAVSVQSHLTRHSSHIKHGSMLATTASADDIVSEGLALCYSGLTHEDGSPRFPLVSVDTAEWVATATNPVMVPTLGSLYRAVRRAYWNELSRYRAMLSGRVVITSLDELSEEDMSAAEALDTYGLATVDPSLIVTEAPLTLAASYWESVATRRPTEEDATLADMLNKRERSDNERNERVHALSVHADRQSMAAGAHPFGLEPDAASALLVDAATAAVVEESGIGFASEHLGVTPETVVRRLETIRIRRAPNGKLVLARIASDVRKRRTTRAQRLSERHGREVSVSRDGTVATPERVVTVPIGTTHAPRPVHGSYDRRPTAHNMPTLATGVPNWSAGDRGAKRDRWAYLTAVSERAHANSVSMTPIPDVITRHHGAIAYGVRIDPDAISARIASRRTRVAREAAQRSNEATQRRLRFLTIARAVRTGLVSVA